MFESGMVAPYIMTIDGRGNDLVSTISKLGFCFPSENGRVQKNQLSVSMLYSLKANHWILIYGEESSNVFRFRTNTSNYRTNFNLEKKPSQRLPTLVIWKSRIHNWASKNRQFLPNTVV
jgi:hypothetical protein